MLNKIAQSLLKAKFQVRLSIVIPCLNEIDTIALVVDDAYINASRLLPQDEFEVIVADNGSVDGTLTVLRRLSAKCRVVHVPIRGYGAALHWGICMAKGTYVLFADADMSYPFSNTKKLIDLAATKQADLVLGSRLRGTIEPKSMPFLNRYLGTPVLTLLIRILYGLPTSDCNSGMRVVRRDFYERLPMLSPGMEWASELLVRTGLAGGSYFEVPIEFKKDQRGRHPHLARWHDGWRHLKSILLNRAGVLHLVAAVLISVGIVINQNSFAIGFFLILAGVCISLGATSSQFLMDTIQGIDSPLNKILSKFGAFQISALICAGLSLGMVLVPNEHLGSKLVLASLACVAGLWLFFMEVLKTLVLNQLPKPALLRKMSQ